MPFLLGVGSFAFFLGFFFRLALLPFLLGVGSFAFSFGYFLLRGGWLFCLFFLALGFLALGFLTTGFFALNLQAQDAEDPRKKGFFVGIAPYTMGVTLEKEVKITEVNDVVIDSVEYDATYGPNVRFRNKEWSLHQEQQLKPL